MEIRSADTAVGDLDVDVCLLPWLGLKGAPDHFALVGIFVQAEPAFKLVVGRHLMRSFGSEAIARVP
jgi:hypothetical protein